MAMNPLTPRTGDVAHGIGGPNGTLTPLQLDPFGALQVTGSLGINTDVQLSGSIAVSNFPATQSVTGTVAVSSAPLTAIAGIVDVTVTGSTGLHVAAPQGSPLWMTGSVGISGITFPETVNVSGAVNAYTSGPQGVSGSVALTNWPVTLNVSASAPIRTYDTSPQGITDSVNVYTSGLQGISGSVSISSLPQVQVSNFPATQAVSGSVSLSNWPSILGVSGSVALTNWPTTINVSSSTGIGVFTTGSLNVTTTGSAGLQVAVTNLNEGMPALSTGIAQNPPANQLNDFPWTLSLTGSLSASNGQALPLVSDFQGNLASREQYAPVAEDNVNGVIAVAMLPLSGSSYTPDASGSVGQLPGVLRASAGNLLRVWLTNRNGAVRYLQLFNSTTGPSGVPLASFQLPASSSVGSSTTVDFAPWGWFFSLGISLGISTSSTTYSAATPADHDFAVLWK